MAKKITDKVRKLRIKMEMSMCRKRHGINVGGYG